MAAGKGTRLGDKIPKQFLELCGKPIFLYSLEAFEKSQKVDGYLLMVPEEYIGYAQKLAVKAEKLKAILAGGATRHETTLIALEHLKTFNPKVVVFHDAARPFITSKLVDEVIEAAEKHGASTAAVKISDTVAYCENGFVKNHVSRENLYRILTPQAFNFELAYQIFQRISGDDGTFPFVQAGLKVAIVPSDYLNFKITFPEDYQVANLLARFWFESQRQT